MAAAQDLLQVDAGFLQLWLAHVALGCYALALTPLFGPRGRVVSVVVAGAAATGVALLAPTWASAVILLASGIVAVALVAATAWTSWALLAPEYLQPRSPPPERPEVLAPVREKGLSGSPLAPSPP